MWVFVDKKLIFGIGALQCHLCSGVGSDRHCELHPFFGQTGFRKPINCASQFCLAAKVIDSETGNVKSFARLCDNINRGNKCFRDSKLLTCYQSCSTDFCNNGNPDPSSLIIIDYSSAAHTQNSSSQRNSSGNFDPNRKRFIMRNNTFLQSSRQLKKKHNSIKIIDFHFEEEIDDDNPKGNLSISAIPKKSTHVNIIDKFRKKLFVNNSLPNTINVFMKPQPYLKDVVLYMGSNSTKYHQTTIEQNHSVSNKSSIIADMTQQRLSTIADTANNFTENNSKTANEAFQENSTDNVALDLKFNNNDNNNNNNNNNTVLQNESLTESNFSDMNLIIRSNSSQLNNSQNNLDLQEWIEFEISQRDQQNDTIVLEEIALNNSLSLVEMLKPLLSHNQTWQNNFITEIFNNSSTVNVLSLHSTVATKQQDLPLADAVFLSSDSNHIINGNKKFKNNEKKKDFGHKTDIKEKEIYQEKEMKRRKEVTVKHEINLAGNNGMEILASRPELLFVCLLKLSAMILF